MPKCTDASRLPSRLTRRCVERSRSLAALLACQQQNRLLRQRNQALRDMLDAKQAEADALRASREDLREEMREQSGTMAAFLDAADMKNRVMSNSVEPLKAEIRDLKWKERYLDTMLERIRRENEMLCCHMQTVWDRGNQHHAENKGLRTQMVHLQEQLERLACSSSKRPGLVKGLRRMTELFTELKTHLNDPVTLSTESESNTWMVLPCSHRFTKETVDKLTGAQTELHRVVLRTLPDKCTICPETCPMCKYECLVDDVCYPVQGMADIIAIINDLSETAEHLLLMDKLPLEAN